VRVRSKGLFEGDGFNQRETPGKFLGIEDQRVVVVAGSHSEPDIFRRPIKIAPGHVDLRNEYPPLRRIINLFEPDGPDRATDIEDGGDADFPREFSVLDYGCHAEIMGKLPGGCKGDLTYGPPSPGHSLWVG